MNYSKNTAPKTFKESEKGFSIAEMVIVMTIIAILSVVAIMSFANQKMYEAETQTLYLIDFFQEARQRALSERVTMRVEINDSTKSIRLINEKDSTISSDDVLIKTSRFMEEGVFIGTLPANVSGTPTELSPVPVTAWTSSNHPLSSGQNVLVLRFKKNGTVENAGTNAVGANATPTGSTIYVWSKFMNDTSTTPTQAQVMRATTVLASSGSARMWKCLFEDGSCSNWTR